MVVIGNEILSGKIVDSNSAFLAKELRSLGVSLERILVIPDDVEVIADTVSECASGFDLVFTSGGVGPTHDDITVEGIAHGFGCSVIHHPELRAILEKHLGEDLTAAQLKMTAVPEGSELITDDDLSFPTVLYRNVYILPGIPEIFEAKVSGLRERFRDQPYHLRQVLVRNSEAELAVFLNATLEAFPDLVLGSYPKLGNPDYSVRVTLESLDEDYVDAALADLVGRLPVDSVVSVER